MAKQKREAAPYFKKSHGRWYFSYEGQTIPLGPDRDAAFAEFHRIKAGGVTSGLTVQQLVDQFLDYHRHVKGSKPGTVQVYSDSLTRFVRRFGRRPANSIGVADLDAIFVGWEIGPSTRSNVVKALRAAFKYGMERHGLKENPGKQLPKPRVKARNIEYSDEFFGQVMAALDTDRGRPFADLLRLMWLTGARPQELRKATAENYSRANKWLAFEEGKNGEERVIHLDDESVAVLDRYLKQYAGTEGPILRNARGRGWTKSAVNSWCHRLKTKHKLPILIYGIRHTWITRAIRRGVNLVYIAQMAGHKDLKQIQQTYNAVGKKDGALKDALRQING